MANKKAVLSRPTPDASVQRNAFDRESMRVYHYSLGQLLPVWFEPVIAGSKIKLNRKIFQRTGSLKTAAFPLLDTHIQYYFVPFRQLWSLWPSFKTGVKDVNSTGLYGSASDGTEGNISMPSRVPYTTMSNIAAALSNMNTNSTVDVFGNVMEYNAIKLLQLLGYGLPDRSDPVTSDVNLWPLLAYHKIYYDHFRNTSYENNKASMYNMDYLWTRNASMALPASELIGSNALLSLHHVNYRDDYFTNIYPSLNYVQSTLVSSASGLPGTSLGNAIGIPSNIINTFIGSSNSNFMGVSNNTSYGVFFGQTNSSGLTNSRFTLQTLRTAFAYDKLIRSSVYAPQRVKDQYEARFGINYPDDGNRSYYIGSFKNDIQIGEVTSTSNTYDSSSGTGDLLGAIGGKGVSFADWGKTLDFNAKEDGIVMAVQYTTIRSCYRAVGIDSYLTKHLPEDYFQPEFMNLGLEPVYGLEFNQSLGTSTILGYRPRNQRYKLGVDKSYGLFADLSQDMSMFINHTDVNRVPASGVSGVNFAWFKVKEADLDSVMEVTYDGTWSTDQFFGQTIFGCTVIQNMSVHGQPSL